MKRKLLLGALLLLSANVLLFTSCEDEKPLGPTVKITELGSDHDNPNNQIAIIGTDAHIEAEITAEGLIESIEVEVHQEGGSFEFGKVYTDSKYVGKKNATLHEHLDIPSEAPAGEYHLHLVVRDQFGQTATAESKLTLQAAPVDITIEGLVFGAGHNFPDNNIGYIGGSPVVEAGKITAKAGIKKIEVFMHSEEATPEFKIEAVFEQKGETELEGFHKHVNIPANAPAGPYHLHFKETDTKGNHTEGSLDVELKAPGITVTDIEIGHDNVAKASNIHTEFKATSDVDFKSVRIRIYKETAPTDILWTKTIDKKDVKTFTFHEHLDATEGGKVVPGDYILEIRVNDTKDASLTLTNKIKITE